MEDILECRACLGQTYSYNSVSVETIVSHQKNILQAIEEIASIEVSPNDILPKQVCDTCFQSLQSAITFRRTVIWSHIELKKRLELDQTDPLLVSCEKPNTRSTLNNKTKHEKSDNEGDEVEFKEELLHKVLKNEAVVNGDKKDESIPDFEDSASDWNDFNNINDSSDDVSCSRKPIEKELLKSTSENSSRQKKTRPKRRVFKKRTIDYSDTSSDNSDSDVPLEKLRKDIKDLGRKTEHKVRRKREPKESNEGPTLCPICGKLFKARQNFNSHMTTVHRKKPERSDKISCLCPDCGRVITGTRQNFVAHRRYHHSDKAQVKKRFTCDVCPRKFYREKNLIIHQRIHKGEKGYVCELCPDKSYTQIGGLILHRRKVHLKKPTCTCNYCGKQFYEKHYLETHIRQWHTGERPFSCEICGKAFSCNGTLLRHRKDSHGEKKPCPKCGKMYTEGELRKHLKRHKIREEGIKRKKYTCEYCGTEMNFTSRKRHLLKQHGIMLRGRGETAERVPISRADAM